MTARRNRSAMRRAVVVSLVLLLLAVGFLWQSGRLARVPAPVREASAPAVVPDEERSRTRARRPESNPEPARGSGADTAPTEGDDVWNGRVLVPAEQVTNVTRYELVGAVVDADDAPVAGAYVQVYSTWLPADVLDAVALDRRRHGGWQNTVWPHARTLVRTDAAGRFAATVVGGEHCHVLAGRKPTETDAFVNATGLLETTVRLPERRHTLRGRVLLGSKRETYKWMPIEIEPVVEEHFRDGCLPLVGMYDTTTDEHGRFAVSGVVPGQVLVRVQGHGVRHVDVQPGRDTEIEIHFPDGTPLHGRVTDAVTGHGVAGATVRPSDGEPAATTDENGRFTLDGLVILPRTFSMLRVAADGYAPAHAGYGGDENGKAREIAVALERPAELRARVLDEVGVPVPAAIVFVESHVAEEGPVSVISVHTAASATGDDGRVHVRGITPATAALDTRVRVYVGGALVLRTSASPARANATLELGDLRFAGGATVSGSISDATGAPAAGAVVVLSPRGDAASEEDALARLASVWLEQSGRRATVAADGSFEMRSVPPGLHDLYVDRAPGLVRLGLAVPPDGALAPLDLRLAAPLSLRLRIVAADGAPFAGATVMHERPSPLPLRFWQAVGPTDANGRVTIEGYAAGARDVELQIVYSDEDAPATYHATPGPTEVELRLFR